MALVIYPLLVISGVGLAASLWLHAALWVGLDAGSMLALSLTLTCIVVWIPSVVIAWRMVIDPSLKDLWNAALGARPRRLRAVVTALTVYAFVNTALQVIPAARTYLQSTLIAGWPVALSILSGFWVAFYAAAVAVCASAAKIPEVS